MPLPLEGAPWNFYRLGLTREKELFKRRRDAYSGAVIPAHIASYYAKFCTEFIGSLQKPYFIDPITYLFAGDPRVLRRFVKDRSTGRTIKDTLGRKKKGDVKRSFKRIVAEYGELVRSAVAENRPLSPADFADDELVSEFVSKVVGFQMTTLAALPAKYAKYAKFARKAGKEIITGNNPPSLLIAPYFYIENAKWLSVNLDLVRRTKRAVGDQTPVFAVIAVSADNLESSGTQLLDKYKRSGADGFFLWVNDFRGDTDIRTLRVVRDFVANLTEDGQPILALYGDAYSLVLSHFGLTGFVSGICYGEKRSVDQDMDVEGQIPPFYYLSPIKKKIQLETELRRFDPREMRELQCGCDVCRRTVDLVDLDEVGTREHFMLVRAEEVARLREGQTPEEMAAELQESYDKFRTVPIFSPLTHLINWSRLLRNRRA